MTNKLAASALATALLANSHALAQTSGSLEGGLQELAQNIVARSKAADREKIAILPFINADGSCSVLSTHIVDELVLSLFSLPEFALKLIERSQLEALIAELQLGRSGPLDPATTRELGSVSGVDALVLGSIAILGDRVRVHARLIGTDTGETFSAAAITVPLTDTIEELMTQPAVAGPTCEGSYGPVGGQPATPQQGTTPREQHSRAATDATVHHPQTSVAGIRGVVTSAGKSEDGRSVVVSLVLENTTEKDLRIALIGPAPVAIDNMGGHYQLQSFSGASACDQLRADYVEECTIDDSHRVYMSPTSYTKLTPGSNTGIVFHFYGNASAGRVISFSSTFALLEIFARKGDNQEPGMRLSTVGFGIPTIDVANEG